jgi:hypothetical protein
LTLRIGKRKYHRPIEVPGVVTGFAPREDVRPEIVPVMRNPLAEFVPKP